MYAAGVPSPSNSVIFVNRTADTANNHFVAMNSKSGWLDSFQTCTDKQFYFGELQHGYRSLDMHMATQAREEAKRTEKRIRADPLWTKADSADKNVLTHSLHSSKL